MHSLFEQFPTLQEGNIVIRRLTSDDKDALYSFVHDDAIYRYLPTFLYERKYDDIDKVIDGLYTECIEESLIMGLFCQEEFVGLVELYALREDIQKVSIGYRSKPKFWSKGIATKMLKIMLDYLHNDTDIEIVTASSMAENVGSGKVLEKGGFIRVVRNSYEDWGFEEPIPIDKWID